MVILNLVGGAKQPLVSDDVLPHSSFKLMTHTEQDMFYKIESTTTVGDLNRAFENLKSNGYAPIIVQLRD